MSRSIQPITLAGALVALLAQAPAVQAQAAPAYSITRTVPLGAPARVMGWMDRDMALASSWMGVTPLTTHHNRIVVLAISLVEPRRVELLASTLRT